MASIASQRIKRDFKEVATDNEGLATGIKIFTVNDNMFKLCGEIRGPPDTVYDGGTFGLDVEIPETYPFHPPKMKFTTKIWHPNISSVTGAICLDILKDQWAASMSLRTVLLSIQALLCCPEPDDPQDAVVANQFREKPEMFRLTARHWAQVYAKAPGEISKDFDHKIGILKEMGVEQNEARRALSATSWDLAKATEMIFS